MGHSHDETVDALDEIIAGFLEAEENGQSVSPDELIVRHSAYADDLRAFFADRDLLRSAARPLAKAIVTRRPVLDRIRYFGDFELLEEIARGGMGIVYQARQTSLNRIVAVKMILAGNLASEIDLRRFRIEAEAAARLQHPNIVSVHEVGQYEGQNYFSMDYVAGRNLAEIARADPLPVRQATKYVVQIAEAVHYAHQQGTLHRDLKPSNILIDGEDNVRITDFGLALNVDSDSHVTETGQVLGTPAYMPPEQAQGRRRLVGPCSDIYSMGAILYELVSGRPPFRGDSAADTLRQVIESAPLAPRLLNASVPRDIETICLKCLEKEPNQRFSTAQSLAEDLRRFLNGEPILARPIGRVARIWRWCRRKPLTAGLLASLLLAVVLTVITLALANLVIHAALQQVQTEKRIAESALFDRSQALEAKNVALEKLDEVNKQLHQELEREEWNAYQRGIQLAQREGDAGNVEIARSLLGNCGPERFRQFEWQYLTRRFQSPMRLEWSGRIRRPVIPLSLTGHAIGQANENGNDRLQLFDSKTGQVITNSSLPHSHFIHGISPDGRWAAVIPSGFSQSIRMMDTRTGDSKPPILLERFDDVRQVFFSDDGNRVAAIVARNDPSELPDGGRINQPTLLYNVWDVATFKLLMSKQPPALPMRARHEQRILLTASPDLRWLLTPNALIDLESSQQILEFDEPSVAHAFSQDSRLAAMATKTGKVSVVDLPSQNMVDVWSAVRRPRCLAFSSDNGTIAAGCVDGSILIRDVVAHHDAPGIATGTSIRNLAFTSNDRELLTVHAPRGGITSYRVWRRQGNSTFANQGVKTTVWGNAVCFSPDSKLVAAVGANDEVLVWNAATGDTIQRLQRPATKKWKVLSSIAFSPDSRHIAASGNDGFSIWEIDSGDHQCTLQPNVGAVRSQVAFGPHGKWIAGVHEGGVTIWDWRPKQLVKAIRSEGCVFASVGFSSNGEFLYTTADRGRGRIWNTRDWSVRCWLSEMPSQCARLSPDDRLLAGVEGQEVKLFDTFTGKLSQTISLLDLGREISFSPEGQRIAATSSNGVRVFDTPTGQLLLTLSGSYGGTTSVAFSPDGRRLAAIASNGTVRIWNSVE